MERFFACTYDYYKKARSKLMMKGGRRERSEGKRRGG